MEFGTGFTALDESQFRVPLDEGGSADKATLHLFANSTRLATWNSKLGLVKRRESSFPGGKLLVKRISDVVPGGGKLPLIRVFVERVYPLLYYEKCEGDGPDAANASSARRPVLTQQEEDMRRKDFEKRRSRAIEKATEQLQSEIEQVSMQDSVPPCLCPLSRKFHSPIIAYRPGN